MTLAPERLEERLDHVHEPGPLLRHIVLIIDDVPSTHAICGAKLPVASRAEFLEQLGSLKELDCVVCHEIHFGAS